MDNKDDIAISTDPKDIHLAVCATTASQRAFLKIPGSKIETFSLDLCLIALSIRTGYLFDAFAFPRRFSNVEVLSELLSKLRETHLKFSDVILVHEPSSEQVLFLNSNLFRQRALDELAFTSENGLNKPMHTWWTSFLLLDQSLSLLHVPPELVARATRDLIARITAPSALPISVQLAPAGELDATSVIPFAALLIEYPVAYVPVSAEQTSFLAGIALDVYECILLLDDDAFPAQHTFLKFSCPCILGETNTELAPCALMVRLETRFGERVRKAGLPCRLTIQHHVETHARVAL